MQCVILNACYSIDQAEKLRSAVPFVIGMAESLHDMLAIRFLLGFYSALAENSNIEESFYYGVAAINLVDGQDGSLSRSLDINKSTTIHPGIDKPILLKNEGLVKNKKKPLLYNHLFMAMLIVFFGYFPYSYVTINKSQFVGEKIEVSIPEYIQIEGKVYEEDEIGQKQVPSAIITFHDINQSTKSFSNGYFMIRYKNITQHKITDSINITVSHDGYQLYEGFISIGTFMNIPLIPVEGR